tara:strand:+ start:1394 stop:1759 length:366 start_codon:yes stop_codon:yes gene_type:complete
MINNIGTDIIEVERIKDLIKDKGDNFLKKIYTKNEIEYCESKGINKYQHYAGRFAAKEAIKKAFGVYNINSFNKIEIINKIDGTPKVNLLSNNDILKNHKILISISHIKSFATANALVYKY